MSNYLATPHVAASTRFAQLVQRIFFSIPVIGWIARDIAKGDVGNVYFALVTFVSLWGISTMTFGLPGLYLPALALVPVMLGILVWISLGKIDADDDAETH